MLTTLLKDNIISFILQVRKLIKELGLKSLVLGRTKKRIEASLVQVQFSFHDTKLPILPGNGACPPIIPSP